MARMALGTLLMSLVLMIPLLARAVGRRDCIGLRTRLVRLCLMTLYLMRSLHTVPTHLRLQWGRRVAVALSFALAGVRVRALRIGVWL